MSIFSTLLIYAIIPLGVIAIVAALVASGSGRSRPARRYRPGRPYDFKPIWFLASPAQVSPAFGGKTSSAPELPAGVLEDATGMQVRPGPTGGASDRW
ncbi:hypothetical protein GCM10020358_80650 [Amorphoplanes nipponensis]|uniref:Uncharacterized protein n=1 Tax=Actinoplanes nipponensis TaxID=135950 RepID=A0A919JS89_9ACTN|nr:hypothetical protein [Actinoplanes nipponensis]GIE54552.1 hypothetical protein Ani05nite_80860 [Actinoplanes nipponensis]